MKFFLLLASSLVAYGCTTVSNQQFSSSEKIQDRKEDRKEDRSISSANGRAYAVCAAEMNTESLGIIDHNFARIGFVHLVDLSESKNASALTNTLYCISKADKMKVIIPRLPNESDQSEINEKRQMLIDIIDGKYFSKKIRILLDDRYLSDVASIRQIRTLDK